MFFLLKFSTTSYNSLCLFVYRKECQTCVRMSFGKTKLSIYLCLRDILVVYNSSEKLGG